MMCPMTGFGISSVEHLGSATRLLIMIGHT